MLKYIFLLIVQESETPKFFKKKKPADDNGRILKKIGRVQFKGVNLTIYD